jgi:tetratricopeptide (TPR) repeat protein
MGEVYEAHDAALDRRVALKVLILDHLDAALVESVAVREGQMLARVAHPHVVAVYDVGVSRGRPFIALEYVAGESLAVWVTRTAPTASELQATLRDLADGLAAIHDAGLIHRDIKPANIIVDADGRARLADLGVAKLLGDIADEDGQPAPATWVGTPGYRAPEVEAGGPATPSSDVHALCASFLGVMPRSRGGRRSRRLVRALEQGTAADPNARPTAAALHRMLAASTRTWIPVSAVASLAGLAGIVGWAVAVRPHPLCEAPERELAGVWDDTSRDALRRAIVATGHPAAAQTWERVERGLDAHAGRWSEQFARACAGAAGLRDDALSEVALSCLRSRRTELRALVGALSEVDDVSVLQAARAVSRLEPIERCTDPAALQRHGSGSEDVRELLAQSRAHGELGEYARSEASAARALAAAEERDERSLQALARFQLGLIHNRRGKNARAVEVLQEAHYDAMDLEDAELLARTAAELVDVYRGLQDARSSTHWARVAKIFAAKADMPLGPVLLREALLSIEMGDDLEAVERLEEALRVLERDGAPPRIVSTAYFHLGSTYSALGRHDEGFERLRRAYALDEEALGSLHPRTWIDLAGIGSAHLTAARHEDAAATLEEALDGLSASGDRDHPEVGAIMTNLAIARGELGDHGAAIDLFRRAAEHQARVAGQDSLRVARARLNLGVALARAGRPAEALAELRNVVPIYEDKLPSDHPERAQLLRNIADVEAELASPAR